MTLPPPVTSIRFDHVGFGYTSGQYNLTDVSYSIPIGARVALVGPSGSGKSTNLSLVMRFFDPNEGRVLIDEHDLREVTLKSLYSHMGVVFQENLLFNTTIRENIRMGRIGATDLEVEAAAKLADLHDFIVGLPQGYDTPVGERGALLSGGQRQRVAIARALIRDPVIIVLDEATAALDPASEHAINETLNRVSQGRTVLSVTHRLQTITAYDLILVFDQGRLVEQGTHAALLADPGKYASLWKRQSGLSLSDDGLIAHIQPSGLKEIPLFQQVDLEELAEMNSLFATEHVGVGHIVIEQGKRGEKLFIIIRGKVSVDIIEEGAEARRLATLADGEFFGEISLLSNEPTTARVTTLQPTIFLTLRRDHFLNFLERHASLRESIERLSRERRKSQMKVDTLVAD